MFVLGHQHSLSGVADAFGCQPQLLIQTSFPLQKNLASRAHYAVPRDTACLWGTQRPDYLSRRAGMACGASDFAVGGYLPARYPANYL